MSVEKKQRLNVVLSAKDKERIDSLVEKCGHDTMTETTKAAFQLLEFVVKKLEAGESIYIGNEDEKTKLELVGLFG